MKSALFVDFDNVYSGLRRLDPETADQFARNPNVWMAWLIGSLALPEPSAPGARRRVLVRRCYLNPQAYQRFRPAFNLAGFEIIDCPALTSEGKTSTDIHMVLDMMDLLQHETHYDEFIVFSADADFTPVLRKLRRWDRRTTVLAIGFPSAAYRASADLLIDQDDFVRKALAGFEVDSVPPPAPVPPPVTANKAAALRLIRQTVAASATPVPLARLASLLLAEVEGLEAATWGGFGSFRALLEALDPAPLAIAWGAGGVIHDPARHVLTPPPANGKKGAGNDYARVAAAIRAEVEKSPAAVSCARLASVVVALDGALAADWGGKGTFRKFIESLDLQPIRFDWGEGGGVASIPGRAPAEVADEAAAWADADLFRLARQLHQVTDVPLLSPRKYRNLLAMIAADVAAAPFHLMETGKRVRDRCRESGLPVSRADVNHVLRGLLIRGHAFDAGPNDAATLAGKLADNLRSLCLREQIVIDEATDAAIRAWIGGD